MKIHHIDLEPTCEFIHSNFEYATCRVTVDLTADDKIRFYRIFIEHTDANFDIPKNVLYKFKF